jgi:ABC-type sugar transport system permease subunit
MLRSPRTGFLLIVPLLVFTGIFVLYPFGSTLVLSFFSQNLLSPDQGTTFRGLANYRYLFDYDIVQPAFWHSTLISGAAIAGQLLLGIPIALLFNQPFPGRGVLRSASLLPWALPTISSAFVMRWMFDQNFGTINQILAALHLTANGLPWLSDDNLALVTMILANIWKSLPFVVLVTLAGLQQVPHEQRESARMDGANAWQEFLHITLPNLRFVIAITVILRFIWTFNWFDFVYMITGGGPGDATVTMPILVYISAFRTFQIGIASAVASLMVVFLLIFAIVFFRIVLRNAEDLA